MRIPRRQRGLLRRMDHVLSQSDPHLAAMLAVFARIYGSEAITSPEQVCHVRVLAALIWVGSAAVHVARCLAAGVRRVVRHVAVACFAVRRRLSGDQPQKRRHLLNRPGGE
jgi:hypothetical protein